MSSEILWILSSFGCCGFDKNGHVETQDLKQGAQLCGLPSDYLFLVVIDDADICKGAIA